jgi:hypothetical protein
MLRDFELERHECEIGLKDKNPLMRERCRNRIIVVDESVRQLKRVMGLNRSEIQAEPPKFGGYNPDEIARFYETTRK